MTRFHSAAGGFGIYLADATAGGCPAGWYYAYVADFSLADDYKQLLAVALTAYAQNKRVSTFYTAADCTSRRFTALDTQD